MVIMDKVSISHRQLSWLTSAFDGCEVRVEQQFRRSRTKRLEACRRGAHNLKEVSPRSAAMRKRKFSASVEYPGAAHHMKTGLAFDCVESEDDSSDKEPQKVFLMPSFGMGSFGMGIVEIMEVENYKVEMQELAAEFPEGVRHLECNQCEARARRKDMIKETDSVWLCESCWDEKHESERQQADRCDVPVDEACLVVGTGGDDEFTPCHCPVLVPDVSISRAEEELITWATLAMPGRKRLKSSRCFRALKEYLAERDSDFDAEKWCSRLQNDIRTIANRNASPRVLIAAARRLPQLTDAHCLSLLVSFASETVKSREVAASSESESEMGSKDSKDRRAEPQETTVNQPAEVSTETEQLEPVECWESLLG